MKKSCHSRSDCDILKKRDKHKEADAGIDP